MTFKERMAKSKEKNILLKKFKSFLDSRYSAGSVNNYSRNSYSYNSDSGSKSRGGTDNLLGSVTYDHAVLRGKSRKAAFDSTAIASIQARKVQSVVDTGIRIDPTPAFSDIGITEDEAEVFLKYAKSINDWMGCKLQHRRGQMTFFQAQALAQTEKVRDGEYFFRLYYDNDPNLPHSLQWESIDADQIKNYIPTYTKNGYLFENTKNISDGIVKDERGRPIEYIIHVEKNGSYETVNIKARTIDGRIQIIHGFTPEYAFQTRGFPANSKILQESQLLQTFSLANINKAINQSQRVFAVFNRDQDPSSPFDEGKFTAALDDYFSKNISEQAEISNNTITNYVNSPLFKTIALSTQPGAESLIMPEKGTDIKAIENTAPVQQYDTFVSSYFAFLAAAENIPIEVALMRFGSNYSASRAALVMYFRICEAERADLDTDLLTPIYEMYISEGVAAGYISAPGWSDPRIRQLYLRHRIIGAPMISIDPSKEAAAALEQIGLSSTSFSRVAQNLNASDFEKNLFENEIYAERISKVRENLGLNGKSKEVDNDGKSSDIDNN